MGRDRGPRPERRRNQRHQRRGRTNPSGADHRTSARHAVLLSRPDRRCPERHLRLRDPGPPLRRSPLPVHRLLRHAGQRRRPRQACRSRQRGHDRLRTRRVRPPPRDRTDFTLIPGDLVSTGTNYSHWKDHFFDESFNLFRHVPVYPVPGNHEQDAHWFFDYFVLPENGTPGFEEHWYWFDHGNVRIIGLDSNGGYRIQVQLDWLDGVLADAASNDDIDFVFAQLHHPYKSEVWSPGDTAYTGDVVRRLETFSTTSGKPSIHFFGHTHAYERGQSRDHQHLWVNAAAGEGGIDYWGSVTPIDHEEFGRAFVDWGFVLVEVEAGDDPKFRLRRVSRGNGVEPRDNDVMDDLTVRMFNDAPETPAPVSPVDGVEVDPAFVDFRASTFSDPDGDDHIESRFQVSATSDFSNVVIDHWARFENWYAPDNASGISNGWYSVDQVDDPDVTHAALDTDLDPFSTYYWRVRYRDDGFAWSDWSDAASFTTGAVPLGPCCLPDGTCVIMPEDDCADLRGDWLGEDGDCADCPPVVLLFQENFDAIALGPNVDEGVPGANVWSETPPAGWTVDDTGVPSGGVTEWRGWAFTDPAWWSETAGNQNRSLYTSASGVVAVADPDEWDDAPRDPGTYNARMCTPAIPLGGAHPGSARLRFDSSWRPEGDQRAVIEVSYDGGPAVNVLTWTTDGSTAHPDAENEFVEIPLSNPAGATSMTIEFGLLDAGNNWWWAIDNIMVLAEPRTPDVVIFEEDFDDLDLGPSIDEPAASDVWTDVPPAGWTIDDSNVPGVGDPNEGVTEWEGWAFTDPAWWADVASDQRRSEFTLAQGAIAVADPDEWDDLGDPEALGLYATSLTTSWIDVARFDDLRLHFDSSWRPEDLQRVTIEVESDLGDRTTILEWDSLAGPTFKPDATNESVTLDIETSPGVTSVRFVFAMHDAANDWWWAIDNIEVRGDCRADTALPFGVLDIFDILTFLAEFEGGADWNADGATDIFDVIDYLAAFDLGCG